MPRKEDAVCIPCLDMTPPAGQCERGFVAEDPRFLDAVWIRAYAFHTCGLGCASHTHYVIEV